MSFELSKKIDFPHPVFQFHPFDINEEAEFADLPLLGGTFSDVKHVWHVKGPCIEARDIQTGKKVGAWVFGGSIKDLQNKIICVDEIKSDNGRLSMLLVALETPSGGQICILDIFSSRVFRAINMNENDQISSIHVIDSGNSRFPMPEPSPLRYFDGIVAIGTKGGNVFLVDLCMQICEDALQNPEFSLFRDELYPCEMMILSHGKIPNIRNYIANSMEKGVHIGIHLNAVFQPETEHFTLLGETGEARLYVNKDEAEVSALYYSFQLASLLVGYNFGAFQLWDLRQLSLSYTSPVKPDHTPVSHFAIQEPDDDPKDYIYMWVSYSKNLLFRSGMPCAVMYVLAFNDKMYSGTCGYLYEDFHSCNVRFELELETANLSGFTSRLKGGSCIGLQSIKNNSSTGSLALCLSSWLVWDTSQNLQTCLVLFDLDQWYKEQMPTVPDWSDCSNYIIKNGVNTYLLDVKLNTHSLSQFVGVQKPEEHFCPTSLSFDVICLGASNILKIHNKSFQNALIDKLKADGHLALCRPSDYYEKILSLGLTPIFFDLRIGDSNDTGVQRELLLSMILEQKLVHWLCNCASKLANDAFNSQGLPLTSLLEWAFQRARHLKSSCDYLCRSLFDFSGVPLDTNTITLVSNSTCQIKHIYSFYNYVSSKLLIFVCEKETLLEKQRCLEYVTVYYEVLLWMVNIGLLPEGQNVIEAGALGTAPYEAETLTKHYIEKRIELRDISRHQAFFENDCLLFIDNMLNSQTPVASIIRQHWQEDGGSGLYPPPSLQSAIRVYLLDGTDLNFKQSLMTYILLDIAANLDENQQRNAIQRLLKFPQIFDLSQSRIKIVQAFWHLDHDDYQTALDYILDPSVLSEDLQHWHHTVMMKNLLLQEQFTLALQYLQVRKPSLADEKDLLTVLSLMISKNLVDEAFKFYRTQERHDDQLLLMHIFKECTRNEQIQSLLFRRLQTDEERSFFKYLQTSNSHSNEDLKIFYHLLRSRFLEAFDTYSNSKATNPETQGLMGQNNATISDSVVKLCKNLMPDINQNLVEIVRKERSNLWKEVKRPTPLSMFAHNAKEKICYKSDMIFATLLKAKRTFNDSFYRNSYKEVNTDSTPFLRTPSGPQIALKSPAPVLNCTIIEQNETEEYGPSPRKKLKLSPRMPTTSPSKSTSNLSLSRTFLTPIVKRKPSLNQLIFNSSTRLPHSILKRSKTFDESLLSEKSLEISRLKFITTSKSMSPSKVKFDVRSSTSSSEQSSPRISDLSTRESENVSCGEVFYSPITSSAEIIHDKDVNDRELCVTPEKLDDIETAQKIKEMTDKIVTDHLKHKMVFQSPKSRQSYKRSIGDSPVPVRSSPRLSRKFDKEGSSDDMSEADPCFSESQPPKPPLVSIQKLRGRRSLARAVLEHNTFSETRVSTYVEKSLLSVSKDSNSSQFELLDSSVDSDGLSIASSTLDDSLLALMKECQDLDSKNSSLNKASQEDIKVSYDGEVETPVERAKGVSKTFEVRVDTDSGEEAGEAKDSCYCSSTVVTSGIKNNRDDSTIDPTKVAETHENEIDTNITANIDINMFRIENSYSDRIAEATEDHKNIKPFEIEIRGYEPTADQTKTGTYENKIDTDITTNLSNKQSEGLSIVKVDIADNLQNSLPGSRPLKKEVSCQNEPENTITYDKDQQQKEKPMDVDDEDALVSAVYDDLSSGSEDLRDILQVKEASFEEDGIKNITNVGSQSFSTESSVVSQNVDHSLNVCGSRKGPLDEGFIADVIEIESSDEDASRLKTQTLHQDSESRSSTCTTDTSSIEDNLKSSDDAAAEGAGLLTYYSEQSNSSSRSGSKNSENSNLDNQRFSYTPDSIKDKLFDIHRDYDVEDDRGNPDKDSSSSDKTSTEGTNDGLNNILSPDIETAEVSSTSSSLKKDDDIKIFVKDGTDYKAQPTELIHLSESKIELEKNFPELTSVGIEQEGHAKENKREIENQTDVPDKQQDIYKIDESQASPIENEEMESLQLVLSNPTTPESTPDSSQLDMTSKASVDKPNQDDLIKKTQSGGGSSFSIAKPDEKLPLGPSNVTDLTKNLVSTPDLLKSAVNKPYFKVEKAEKEPDKTPVLKPVKETYLRRGRSGSQSSTLSGNETEDMETTKPFLLPTTNTLKETAGEEISKTTQEQPSFVNKEVDKKESSETVGKKEKLVEKTALDTQESSVFSGETRAQRRITRRMSAHFDLGEPIDSPTSSEFVQKMQTDNLSEQMSLPGPSNVTDLNQSLVSTPVLLKSAVNKTYSKVEKAERDLNKTPVLKPVKKTYLRRGRSGSQSSTFSGNETEDMETTKPSSLHTLQETAGEEISSTTQEQPSVVNKEEDKKKSSIDNKEKLSEKTASDTEESSVCGPGETGTHRRITDGISAHIDLGEPIDSPTSSELLQKMQTDNISQQISLPGTPKRPRPSKAKSKSSSLVSNTEGLDEDNSPKQTKVTSEVPCQTLKTYFSRTKIEKPSLKGIEEKSSVKRLRSASVDQPQVIRTYSRKLRSKSVDKADEETSSETERFKEKPLKVLLEPIMEIPTSKVKTSKTATGGKAKSDIGAYTTTRRLTRTQASILKSVVGAKKKFESLEEIDPINLLDKPLFQGDPDPDESKVYEHNSSASSSPSVSASQRSRRRSTSVVSDAPSLKPPSVSSKASKITGMKSRLRSGSEDGHSDTTDSPSPSKKSKSKEDSKNSKPATKITRARSVSSNKSNTSNASNKTNTSARSTRSRKIQAKEEWPEIKEETEDFDSPVSSTKGRPKRKIK